MAIVIGKGLKPQEVTNPVNSTEPVETVSPTPEVTPEVVPDETPEVTPEVTSEVTPEPTLEATPEPTPEATPEPTPKPTPKPTPRKITQNKILFPSDSKYITLADINGLSKYDIDLIRNEIFARKGYVFTNKTFKNYFESQEWYTPNPSANNNMSLNQYETYNAKFLKDYQEANGMN